MSAIRVALAGVLALPALLLIVATAPLVFILAIPALLLLVQRKPLPNFSESTNDAAVGSVVNPMLHHAVITGGSSGIGLAIATDLARRGCRHITLLARKEKGLNDAKRTVEAASSKGSGTVVRTIPVDVVDGAAVAKAAKELCEGASTQKDHAKNENGDDSVPEEAQPGPPTLLFNCAGFSVPSAFTDLRIDDFDRMMDVNYLGSVHATHSFVKYMKKRGFGTIVLTSSAAGQVGVYGFTAYAPTKFALRGLAEALTMELLTEPGINVQVTYPPDTDTPGYETENKVKPRECHLISDAAGLFDPAIVGKKMVDEAIRPKPRFNVYFGLEGWMLSTLTAGMSPATNIIDALCQVSLMGLFRLVSLFYLMDFGSIVRKCHNERQNTSKHD